MNQNYLLPPGRSFELSMELLKGAIDIHVHAGPHIFSSPRRVDPVEAAIEARDAGMRAIVYMDVFEMSNGTSWIVNRVVKDFETFGGLIMNTAYGGMNPRSVKTALYYGTGAKFVSFGAHSTYFQASRRSHRRWEICPAFGALSVIQDRRTGPVYPNSAGRRSRPHAG